MSDNTSNRPSKFRTKNTKNWVEINDASRVWYNVNSQIKSKAVMLNLVCVMIVMHIYLLKKP